MAVYKASWVIWILGTILIVLQWFSVVPAWVGGIGFGVACAGVILSFVSHWMLRREARVQMLIVQATQQSGQSESRKESNPRPEPSAPHPAAPAELEEKIRGGTLTLEDFHQQLQQVKRMGNLQDMLGLLPGMCGIDFSSAQGQIPRIEAIIGAMTPEERANPRVGDVLDDARIQRIAVESGTGEEEVRQLLKQFRKMRNLMGGGQ